MKTKIITAALIILTAACSKKEKTVSVLQETEKTSGTSIGLPVTLNYNFEKNADGWVAGYSDYPANLSQNDSLVLYAMSYGHGPLPAGIVPAQKGMRIRGHNRPDDLFMFFKKKITGLTPNAVYSIAFDIDLASNAPTHAVGVGGAPGEDVILKAGAKSYEPLNNIIQGFYRINIDKGNQATGGADMKVLGHIGVADNTTAYTLINRNNYNKQLVTTAGNNGELWLITGTDSGYEGLTELYYANIKVVLQPL
jgi:hypothetical protein